MAKLNDLLTKQSFPILSINSKMLLNSLSLRSDFAKLVTENFQTELDNVQLNGDAQEVNNNVHQWIANRTGQVRAQSTEDAECLVCGQVQVLLLNAATFKGIWKHKFDEEMTEKNTFHNPGEHVQVDFMKGITKVRVLADQNMTWIELPIDWEAQEASTTKQNDDPCANEWSHNLNLVIVIIQSR